VTATRWTSSNPHADTLAPSSLRATSRRRRRLALPPADRAGGHAGWWNRAVGRAGAALGAAGSPIALRQTSLVRDLRRGRCRPSRAGARIARHAARRWCSTDWDQPGRQAPARAAPDERRWRCPVCRRRRSGPTARPRRAVRRAGQRLRRRRLELQPAGQRRGGWAAAEVADRSFGELLTAVVAGAEVGGYLRRWLAATWSGTGSTRRHARRAVGGDGGGRLLGLSVDELAGALAGAACLTPRPRSAVHRRRERQDAVRRLAAPGRAVGVPLGARRHGRAAGGAGGSRAVAQSFLDAGGPVTPPPFEPGRRGWEVEAVTFKPFPSCRRLHPALTVARRARPCRSRDVRVRTYPYAVELERRVRGHAPIAAQASVRW
jgi:hypothetical protein